MTFSGIISLITAEVKAFYLAGDKRAHLLDRVGALYDQYIEPLDTPGPDALFDWIVRPTIIFLAGTLYDAWAWREDKNEPHPPWPSLPDSEASEPTETPTEEPKPCDD